MATSAPVPPFPSPPLTFANTKSKRQAETARPRLLGYELNTYSAGAKVCVRSRYSRM